MTRTSRATLGLVIVMSTAGIAQKPQLPAEVAGIVTDGAGRPLSRATVRISNDSRGYVEITDDTGRFRVSSVLPGQYQIVASRNGYLLGAIASAIAGPRGIPLTVTGGQRIDDVVLTLRKGGTISGVVRDEFGDPVLMVVTASNGIAGMSAVTDQQGRYRLMGLAPGAYIVGTQTGSPSLTMLDASGNERTVAIAPAYYPGVPSPSMALRVKVGSDADATGIDLHVRYVPASSLTVTLSAPGPIEGTPQLEIRGEGASPRRFTNQMRGEDGTYRLDGVVAGSYVITGLASVRLDTGVERRTARLTVSTDGTTPAAVTLPFEPGARVAGRIVVEGQDPQLLVSATLVPMDRATMPSYVPEGASGTFTLTNVAPGEYIVRADVIAQTQALSVHGATRWMLRSVTAGGQEILDVPIRIGNSDLTDLVLTMSDRVTELSGRITNPEGKPLGDLTLMVFSADPRHWYQGSPRVRTVLPDATGRYRLEGLVPGDYWLAALTGGPQFQNELVAGLTELASAAVRISLAEGERKRQDLRVNGR